MTTAALRASRLLLLLLFLIGLKSLAGGSASGAVLESGFWSGHSTVEVNRSDSSGFVVPRESAAVARRLSLSGRRARCASSSSSSFGPSVEGITLDSSLRSRNGGRGAIAHHWCVISVRTGHSAARGDLQSSWAGSPKATAFYAYDPQPSSTTPPVLIATNTRTAPEIQWDKQGKHFEGHNNYISGRSQLTANPEKLAQRAGSGDPVGKVPRGQAGFKERVDFGEPIGKYVDPATGAEVSTTKGIIHYDGKGQIHIVPARP